ncbi:hypothetical protein E2C01_080109 [Portunus trituberculatus]|uniref:Uncharacterized protein n=1 Tax=Portunus trituberculatus TaxID=210409 RepID=A0A5B7IT60_PORTR|nr:hypothetical protein [Portunus trituberculatus]
MWGYIQGKMRAWTPPGARGAEGQRAGGRSKAGRAPLHFTTSRSCAAIRSTRTLNTERSMTRIPQRTGSLGHDFIEGVKYARQSGRVQMVVFTRSATRGQHKQLTARLGTSRAGRHVRGTKQYTLLRPPAACKHDQ